MASLARRRRAIITSKICNPPPMRVCMRRNSAGVTGSSGRITLKVIKPLAPARRSGVLSAINPCGIVVLKADPLPVEAFHHHGEGYAVQQRASLGPSPVPSVVGSNPSCRRYCSTSQCTATSLPQLVSRICQKRAPGTIFSPAGPVRLRSVSFVHHCHARSASRKPRVYVQAPHGDGLARSIRRPRAHPHRQRW